MCLKRLKIDQNVGFLYKMHLFSKCDYFLLVMTYNENTDECTSIIFAHCYTSTFCPVMFHHLIGSAIQLCYRQSCLDTC